MPISRSFLVLSLALALVSVLDNPVRAQAPNPGGEGAAIAARPAPAGTGEPKSSITPATHVGSGRWLLRTYGSTTVGERGTLYLGHVGLGYHVHRSLSLHAELASGSVDPRRQVGTTRAWGSICWRAGTSPAVRAARCVCSSTPGRG